jgi:DNA-binding LacI/PurR family transcriptional regulator
MRHRKGGSKSKGVTLAQIAAELQVSVATVSNAFNRPEKLSPSLRSQIFDTAQAMGYYGPNPVGRSLQGGSTRAVGWVITEELSYLVSDPATLPFMQGMADELQRAGMGLLILPCSPNGDVGDRVIGSALVDGFVATYPKGSAHFEAIRRRGLPVVVVEQPTDSGHSEIMIDQRGGAAMAARHVIELGHQRFGIVSLKTRDDGYTGELTNDRLRRATHEIAVQRIEGYRAELRKLGARGTLMYESSNSRAGGLEAGLWMLKHAA